MRIFGAADYGVGIRKCGWSVRIVEGREAAPCAPPVPAGIGRRWFAFAESKKTRIYKILTYISAFLLTAARGDAKIINCTMLP